MISSKPNRCKHCKQRMPEEFARHVLHEACIPGFLNAMADKKERARKKKEAAQRKLERAETRRRKEAAKTRPEWLEDVQRVVNSYVRARDRALPCISCGKPPRPGDQAGHFRSRGAAKHLALDPRNIHRQCVQCNMHKHSNALDYRIGLIARYGVAYVEEIEADQAPRKYTIDDLKQIKLTYRAKLKALMKEEET